MSCSRLQICVGTGSLGGDGTSAYRALRGIRTIDVTDDIVLLTNIHNSFASDKCMPPDPPYQPQVIVISDSEVTLSWKPGPSEGSSPIQYYIVEFIR